MCLDVCVVRRTGPWDQVALNFDIFAIVSSVLLLSVQVEDGCPD